MDSMFRWKVADGIELELLEQRHAEALFALTEANRQYLRQWLPWVDSTRSVADTSKFIASAMQQFADNKGFIACIWHRGVLCGVIGHHGMDRANRATSLGYWVDAAHQGKGIVTAVAGRWSPMPSVNSSCTGLSSAAPLRIIEAGQYQSGWAFRLRVLPDNPSELSRPFRGCGRLCLVAD